MTSRMRCFSFFVTVASIVIIITLQDQAQCLYIRWHHEKSLEPTRKLMTTATLEQIFDALGFEWTNKPHNEKIKTRSVPVLKSKNELIKQDHDEQQQQEEVEEAMNAPDLLDESREANLTTSSSRPLNPGLSDQLDDVLGTILLGIKGYRGDRRFDFPIRSYVKDNDYNKH